MTYQTKDLKAFNRMTRQRFRWLKILIRKYKDFNKRVKLGVYSLLYRCRIIKRYLYADDTKVPVDFSPALQQVDTTLLHAVVIPHVFIYEHIDMDYFYIFKRGKKKILYTVKNDYDQRTVLEATLDHVGVRFDGKLYLSDLPIVKMAVMKPEKVFRPPLAEPITKQSLEYETVEYDLSAVKHLRCEYVVSNVHDEEELHFAYNNAVRSFLKHLEGMTILDLKV